MSTRTENIAVAYDGSPDAELALVWAVEAADRAGSPLKVVVVADPEDLSPGSGQEARRWADTMVARARVETAQASSPVEVALEHGGTLPVLLDVAAKASMIVLGSRGHSFWDTMWLGSTSQHLAGHADCAVAVIRPRHNPRSNQIVVGIDGSPASARALDYAIERASGTGEEVLAVHAYQQLSFAAGGRTGALAQDIDTKAVEAAERLAAELVAGADADRSGVAVRASGVIGRPGETLARLSAEASLVVVGSRGRTPVQQLLLGSVSHEVLHRAECPVVVVR